ncbi:MAG: hypothetical protein KAQ68_05060 [Clostridiales bacterium]|nr:hypothetical protein [Clostridiales bacterium]
MKQKTSFIITLWWILLMIFLCGMLLWIAPREERMSESENRILAGAPKLNFQTVLDSTFMGGVERFISDGFFQREKLIEVSANIKSVFNMQSVDDILEQDMEQAVNEFVEEPSELEIEQPTDNLVDITAQPVTAIVTPTPTDATSNTSEYQIKETYTLWMELSDGSTHTAYEYSIENLDKAIEAMNAYRQVLPEDGTLHFMQIPYAATANRLVYRQDKYVGWGCDAEEYMRTKAVPGVILHSGTDILEPYLLEQEGLYFRTDYHWAPLGAYYAHVGIMQAQGIPTVDYDSYDYTIHEEFLGRTYTENPTPQLKELADRLEVWHPILPTQSYVISNLTKQTNAKLMNYDVDRYIAYLGGTYGPWRRFVTGADTGRRALIVSDSFGNAFAPYMFPYYEEVHMLDLRPAYYDKQTAGASVKAYIEQYEIDDIYIILATSSSMNTMYMRNYLLKYLE